MTNPSTSRVRLLQPGTWIEAPPQEAHEVGTLFIELTNHLLDANLALELFDQAVAVSRVPPGRLDWNDSRQRRRNGRMPFMHARAFVFALDLFERTLCGLRHREPARPSLVACYNNFVSKFPGLKGVRDSEHHRYERVQRKARRKNGCTVINPKAIHTSAIKAPAGAVMIIGDLMGTEFTFTDADGAHAKVDVTVASLNHVAEAMQRAIGCFDWKGMRQEIEL